MYIFVFECAFALDLYCTTFLAILSIHVYRIVHIFSHTVAYK